MTSFNIRYLEVMYKGNLNPSSNKQTKKSRVGGKWCTIQTNVSVSLQIPKAVLKE